MFGLTTDLTTNIDFTKKSNAKVRVLTEMQVLLLDEVSMLDLALLQDITTWPTGSPRAAHPLGGLRSVRPFL